MKPPRILIDARMIGPQGHGIARYVRNLAEGLARLKRRRGELAYEPIFLVTHPIELSGFETLPCRAGFLHLSEQWVLPRVIRRHGFQLFHSPSFSSVPRIPCPWIQTIHDLIHLQYGGFVQKLYYRFMLKPYALKARMVITVSEFSRRELSQWLGASSPLIELAPNAVEAPAPALLAEAKVNAILARYGLERGKYFLTLAPDKPHKNLGLLVRAYQVHRYQRKAKGLESWPLAMTARFESVPEGVIRLNALSDADAMTLIHGAGALLSPSLLEGFGLPPVEAAILGTPIIVSRIPAHVEALAELGPHEAVWLDPQDAQAWMSTFDQASAGALPRPAPASAARVQARYGIGALGESMDRIYQRVLNGMT